ncbi:MAG: zinc metallopeptidase [Bacteroidetes bacterium]|nr:zinc metallopeptidase [Bacteroidota bacterium]
MLWRGRRSSDNVEDRRGMSGGRIATGGGAAGIVIYIIYTLVTGDTSKLENVIQENASTQTTLSAEDQAAEDTMAQFVSVVLAETEDVWSELFQQNQMTYVKPRLVLFRNQVQSACGGASSASGPFYCPGDQKLYIDLSFYEELRSRFHASGDFAMAYVIAHEVGHHVQNLLGESDKLNELRNRLDESAFNKYSVRFELQADYLAGVWAHFADRKNHIVENGDLEEAIRAASAVGDDNIQKQTQGYVVPDAFTHGTSEERMKAFQNGYETGQLRNTPGL